MKDRIDDSHEWPIKKKSRAIRIWLRSRERGKVYGVTAGP